MSRDRVFPAEATDRGPAGLLDLLLGLHAALTRATELVDDLARPADAPGGDVVAAPEQDLAAPPERDVVAGPLVDVMLGVVSFARTFLPALTRDDDAVAAPSATPGPSTRENLLR